VSFNRVAFIGSTLIPGVILVLYVAYSSFRYLRSTFFVYPNVKQEYEIVGKIDTPEEALEACRSNFGLLEKGKYINLVRENIWESKIRSIKKNPFYSTSGDPKFFQIRVFEGLSNDWSVVSSYETDSSKECFLCYGIEFGAKSTTTRCHISTDGKLL
jgi:hypothetical protein